MDEIWKPIESLGGKYEISNFGRIRGIWSGKILKLSKNNAGYYYARVHKGNNKNITIYIHKMVALAFIPNPENKLVINHIDGDKTNNVVENLEWVTHQENTLHAMKLGLMNVRGENHPSAKLTEKDVKEIRSIYKKGSREFGLGSLGKRFGVKKSVIYNIIHYRTWKFC